MAPTYRLTLEYDGAEFHGWQTQAEGQRTVQGTLEAALARISREPVRVMGSGRTDAGVHAEGQVASFALETPRDPDRLRTALNGLLPEDVAVLELREAWEGFDARRDARSKCYRYSIWNGPIRTPLRAHRALSVRRPLDVAAMRTAARDLVGVHDFSSFQAAGSSVTTPVRTLTRLEIEGAAGGPLELWFEASGFLRHMVRNLVGTLVEVGTGRRPATGMPALLAARDRGLAGPTAPAHPLSLVRVDYDAAPDGASRVADPRDFPGRSDG